MEKGKQVKLESYIKLGEFYVDLMGERLLKNEEIIKIEPQIFACLALLITRSPKVVSKEEIQTHIWSGRHVSDEAIRATFKKLRHVLADDARVPFYIKTIPRQGYKLIAPISSTLNDSVNELENKKTSINRSIAKYPILLIISALLVLIAVIFWWNTEESIKLNNSEFTDFKVTKLTQLAGSEIYASYHNATQKIAFSHRSDSNAPQQIFIKNLLNNRLQKLSWDNAHYTNVHWSKAGDSLAFTRYTEEITANMVVTFNKAGNIKNITKLNSDALKDKFVIGWAGNEGLYLAQDAYTGKSLSIYRFDLNSSALTKVTSPQVAGTGDYLAAESIDGMLLAVLREVANDEYALLIVDLNTGSMLANRIIPVFANRIIWHADNNTVTVSAFNGSVIKFDIKKNSLTPITKLPAYANDIFAVCGPKCYFMRQHNGNYLDIQEQPDPFTIQKFVFKSNDALHKIQTKNNLPRIVTSDIFALPGSQDLPTYSKNANTIYFATLTNNAMLVNQKTIGNKLKNLACWPADTKISSLKVNNNGTYFAAVANNRLIIQRINSTDDCLKKSKIKQSLDQPIFITNALQKVSNIAWASDNQSLYLTVYENGIPKIKKLDVKSGKQTHIVDNYVAYRPIFGVKGYNVLVIDQEKVAWLIKDLSNIEHSKTKLAKLDATSSHRWSVSDKGLYFTSRTGREAFLHQISFDNLNSNNFKYSENVKSTSIGHNRFRLSFDLHPFENKILLVESLSAQSDLVKVTW